MAKEKKNPNAQYAFIGLIVAGLACVSIVLVGSAQGLVAAGMFTLDKSVTDNLTLALQISIGLLIIALAVYAILSPDSIRRIFTGRQARYGSNSLILILAFLGIIFAVNYIVFNNAGLLGSPWDFTEDQSNTLAPETLQILATLPEKVTATAFYTNTLDTTSAAELLAKFKSNSGGKFTYSFKNPDTDPVAAREAGITGDGKILLQMGATKEIASSASETELARTMIRLISPESRAVYFLQGHGEPGLDGSGDVSYSTAKGTLESKNYKVDTLNLLGTNQIPADAVVIVIAGPTKPVSQQEVSLLKKFVDGGGSLLVMEDPLINTEFGDLPDPLAAYLTKDWAITLDNDMVIDLVNTQNPLMAVSSQYSQHPITQDLSNKYIVILPQARSLSLGTTADNITVTPLISTTDQSWGETTLVANETPAFDGNDLQGPLTLAAAGENTQTKGRVVVFGNSPFATDQIFDQYGDGNIFINSVDWAAQQENLLNLTTRQAATRTFTPPSNTSFLMIVIVSLLIIPGLVIFFGVYTWITRRRRG